ncbi:hypothetical protein NBRC116589_20310 [Ruegeria sp. HU-ET01832]
MPHDPGHFLSCSKARKHCVRTKARGDRFDRTLVRQNLDNLMSFVPNWLAIDTNNAFLAFVTY